MAGCKQGLLLEFRRCCRTIDSFSAGQASVVCTEDRLDVITACVRPNDGPYEGGEFYFQILIPASYPDVAPEVTCLNRIYHPNIDPTESERNVCLSLFDEWCPNYGLDDVIQGLLFLLHNPNLHDPYSPFFEPDMDAALFFHNVRQSMHGVMVEDFQFDVTLANPLCSTINPDGATYGSYSVIGRGAGIGVAMETAAIETDIFVEQREQARYQKNKIIR